MSTKTFNTEEEGDTSPSKRSPRKRKNMDTTGDEVDEDDRKRSKSDGQGKRKRDDGESETVVALSDSESDFDPDDDDSKAKPSPKRSRTTTHEADTDNACPHCHKVFQSRLGLKYHVKNKVCQRDESVQPVRRRGKAKANVSGKKRTRGKLEDRTCPNCKFVFTSVLGLQYHLKKKVCETANTKGSTPFHTLQPGEKFVTMFGVVEVVKDDRATPTTAEVKNLKDKNKLYQIAKRRIKEQKQRHFQKNATILRARRMRVDKLYERGNINKASVFHAYYGKDPTTAKHNGVGRMLVQTTAEDPAAPTNSFPDRIVECILLPSSEAASSVEGGKTLQRLFLQRRLLVDKHVEGSTTYTCEDCGKKFLSEAGYKYHVNEKSCIFRNENAAASRREQQKKIEDLASAVRTTKWKSPASKTPFSTSSRRRLGGASPKKKRKRKKDLAMYPEVLISLGYKLVKENLNEPPPAINMAIDAEIKNSLKHDRPDALLRHLEQTLIENQRVSDNQKYGSMYAEVYKTLGFKKPRAHKAGKKENNIGTTKRRRRATVAAPQAPAKPPLPIIDVSALADEVDSGRYPSKKRYEGDDHRDTCGICKKEGTLFCCDFCSNAVHMECILKKFTLKTPEPDEDFMCNKCISTILSRRKRAEGRRLLKQQREEKKREAEERENPDIQRGKEYEHLASKGQEYNVLVELLQDARVRLRQTLATRKINDVRRRILEVDSSM